MHTGHLGSIIFEKGKCLFSTLPFPIAFPPTIIQTHHRRQVHLSEELMQSSSNQMKVDVEFQEIQFCSICSTRISLELLCETIDHKDTLSIRKSFQQVSIVFDLLPTSCTDLSTKHLEKRFILCLCPPGLSYILCSAALNDYTKTARRLLPTSYFIFPPPPSLDDGGTQTRK